VIVPAKDEAERIGPVLAALTARYPNVVVVDDGSEDETAVRAREHTPHVLRHLINRGQGAALQTGLEYALAAGARYLVTFDADGQHDVLDLAPLLAPLVAGECDVTLGSRFLGRTVGLPPGRRLLLRAAVLFSRLVHRVPLSDAHNGLRAFTRRAAGCLEITLDGMAHASEIIDLIVGAELRFQEVAVTIRYSNASLAKGQRARAAFRIVFQYVMGRLLP